MNQNKAQGESDTITVLSDPVDLTPNLNVEKKSMVLFEMTACPYCRMFKERFLELVASRARDFDFLRVTLDDPGNPLWHRYEIRAVPTVIVFAKGQIVSRLDSILFLGITKKNWTEFCAGL